MIHDGDRDGGVLGQDLENGLRSDHVNESGDACDGGDGGELNNRYQTDLIDHLLSHCRKFHPQTEHEQVGKAANDCDGAGLAHLNDRSGDSVGVVVGSIVAPWTVTLSTALEKGHLGGIFEDKRSRRVAVDWVVGRSVPLGMVAVEDIGIAKQVVVGMDSDYSGAESQQGDRNTRQLP